MNSQATVTSVANKTGNVLIYSTDIQDIDDLKSGFGVSDHTALSNIGTNSHTQIDSHLADTTLHFTEASIDHANIANVGTKTHAEIDTHIANIDSTIDTRITAQKAVINGLATLDGTGKIPSSQLNAIAVTAVTVVADIAARDALIPNTGDIAKLTTGDTYIYDGSAWILLQTSDSVLTVNNQTGNVTLTTSDLIEGTNLYYTDTRADTRITVQKAAVNGLATLDATGKIPSSQLNAIAVTNVDVVADIAVRDALTPVEGDVAKVISTNETWIYDGTAWIQITDTANVLSVNNQTGTVNLTTTDIVQGTNLYYTDAQVDVNANVVNSITHIANDDKHRIIDDNGTSATDLWSADKIQAVVSDYLAKNNNLSDIGSAETARFNLEIPYYSSVTTDPQIGDTTFFVGEIRHNIVNNTLWYCVNANGGWVQIDNPTVEDVITNLTTDDVLEGTNQYYTEARVNTNANVASATAHIGNNDIHRVINDSGTANTDLWSASKIQSEISNGVGGITYDQTLNTSDNVEFVDMTVNGDLKVNGTTTTINSTEVSIDDPTLHLAANNMADISDIGVHGCFMNTNMYCTGIRRDATNKEWYLFKDYDMTTNGALDETTDLSTLSLDNLNVGDINVAGNSANTHITDDTKHRVINDSGTANTDLWSADKIASEISNGIGSITYDQTLNTTDDVIFNNVSVGAAGTSQIKFDPLKKSDGTTLSNTDFTADGGINEIALTLAEVADSEEFKMNTFGFVGIASDDIDYTEIPIYSPDGFETGITGATISNAGLTASITDALGSDQRYVGVTNTFSSDDTAVFEFKASGIISTFLNPSFGLMYNSTVREPATTSYVGIMMTVQFNPTQLLANYVKNDPVGGAWEMATSSGERILIQSPTFTFADEEKFKMTYNGSTTDFTLEQDKGAGYVQVFTHKFSDFMTTYPTNEPLTFFVGDSNANNNNSGPIVFDILNSGGGAGGTILTYETNENKMIVYQSDGSIVDKGTTTIGFPTFVSTDIIKVVSSGSNIQFQKNGVNVSSPYAVPTGTLRYAVGSTTGTFSIDTQQKITASLDVKTHIEDSTKHRVINDTATAVDELWSSDKINTSLSSSISPSADNTYDLGSGSFRYNECYADIWRGRYLRSVGNLVRMDSTSFQLQNTTATVQREGHLYMDTNGIFNIAGDSLGGLFRILTRGDGTPANSGDILIGSGYQIQATFSHENGVILDADTKINATTNTQDILPLSNNTYNLGSATLEFNKVNCAEYATSEGVLYLNANSSAATVSLSTGQLDVWGNDINNTGNIEAKLDNMSDIGSNAIKYKDLYVNNIKNAGGNIPIDTGCIVVKNTDQSTNEATICMNSADQFIVGAFTQGGDMSIFTQGNGVPAESGVISMNPGETPVASFSEEEGFSVVTDFRYNMGAVEMYVENNVTSTVMDANIPVKILFFNPVDSYSAHFSVDTTVNLGRITYNGMRKRRVHGGCTISWDSDEKNTVQTFYLYKNGVKIPGSSVRCFANNDGKYQSTAIHSMFEVDTGDWIEVWGESDIDCNITVPFLNLFMMGMPNVI